MSDPAGDRHRAPWIAHAVEQSDSKILIRPKLKYVGPAPKESLS